MKKIILTAIALIMTVSSFCAVNPAARANTDDEVPVTYNYEANITSGWVKSGNNWYYYNTDGVMVTDYWVKWNNNWYYLKSDGVMAANETFAIKGKHYHFNSGGAMITGWHKTGNDWYYYNSSGDMLKSGWVKWSSSWYYMKSNGIMASGESLNIKGINYRFKTDGAMATSWYKDGNDWYYYNSDGSMKTGWIKWNDEWYYLKTNGIMAANEKTNLNGIDISFNANGTVKYAGSITKETIELLIFAQEVLRLVNIERADHGLQPVTAGNEILNKAAMTRAAEITAYYSHARPDGRSCFTAYSDLADDRCYAMGENIAMGYGTPDEVVQAWMDSPGHRANILNARYTHLGVGVEKDSYGRLYWVQLFYGQGISC